MSDKFNIAQQVGIKPLKIRVDGMWWCFAGAEVSELCAEYSPRQTKNTNRPIF